MGHSFDMLTFDFLLKPPQPVTGLFLNYSPRSASDILVERKSKKKKIF